MRAPKQRCVGLCSQPAAKLDGALGALRRPGQPQPCEAGTQHPLVALAGRQAQVSQVPELGGQGGANNALVQKRVPGLPVGGKER